MKRRLRVPRMEPRLWRAALLLVVLGAFGAQQWIAQTHWHAEAAAHAGSSAQTDTGSGDGRDPNCLACQIVAHAGAVAPPSDPLALVPATQLAFVLLPAGFDAGFVLPPAFAWRSRGPPAA